MARRQAGGQDSGSAVERSRQCRSSGQDQDSADADTQNFDLRTGQVCATGRRYYCHCHQLARQTPLFSQLDAKIAGASMMTSYCRVYLVVVFVDNPTIGSLAAGGDRLQYASTREPINVMC
ncbi:GD19134 [Drosophila simulans]|uniref:GD19134 n=1 Tax=Drosophila simulans TaxID=7240 RepID=B4QWC6_DROSI|nr:GD19134 [Drosophila simulans]